MILGKVSTRSLWIGRSKKYLVFQPRREEIVLRTLNTSSCALLSHPMI